MTVLSPGTVVDRYRVDAPIGCGSMGDVVLATDVDLRRSVAIKILNEKHRNDKELRARFAREGRAVAAISHPNVVQVFATGIFDDLPYIAMEFLRGVDLGTVVREQGTMSSAQAARAVLDAAKGLLAAADASLIHRDVKPSNLVLLESGVVKVTDFGLAKPLGPEDGPALTAMGVVVGTPDFIAPEQAQGESINEKVDIYSLGGTLYFLLTGSPPFRTGNAKEDKYLKVIARHLKNPRPDPRRKNKTSDDELSLLTMKMMDIKPSKRPAFPVLIAQLEQICERLARVKNASGVPDKKVQFEGTDPTFAPTPFLGGTPGAARVDDEQSSPSGNEWGDAGESFLLEGVRDGPPWKILAAIAGCAVLAGIFWFLNSAEDPPLETVSEKSAENSEGLEKLEEPPEVEVPDGMLLVAAEDDMPAFFCGIRAVSIQEYVQHFPSKKRAALRDEKTRRAIEKLPVTNVSYEYATAFAEAHSGSLPTEKQYKRCQQTKGFVNPAVLSKTAGTRNTAASIGEWVREIKHGRGMRRPMILDGKVRRTRPIGQKNIAFRIIQDIP